MPGSEQFLAHGELPGGVLLLLALPRHLLLTLRHCIEHMVSTTAQRPHLEIKSNKVPYNLLYWDLAHVKHHGEAGFTVLDGQSDKTRK